MLFESGVIIMSKVWVNIAKWLKPVGSTFTVRATLDGNSNLMPMADPADLFNGNWIEYQKQGIADTTYTFITYKRLS